jgi:ATP-grasp ribosomal peptide maturase
VLGTNLRREAAVLVLTQPEDATADLVLDELNRRGVAFVRCDPGDFPASLVLSAHHGEGSATWTGSLCGENRRVALESIRSIYYRRPSEFRFPERMSTPERRFAGAAARHGVAGVLAGLDGVRWVNHPSAMADARVKPYQLAVAARCGLATPATLLTNDPEAVAEFAVAVGGCIVTKALAASTITEQGRSGVVYTTEVSPKRWDDPAIAATAHLFQEYVPGVDVRLTLVGQSVFAAAIHPRHANDDIVDIRAHYADVDYSIVSVPDSVRRACQTMLDRLGLVYGACDFRVDEGRWTLLELNPNGQWAFVPDLRIPIASAFADVIEEGIDK